MNEMRPGEQILINRVLKAAREYPGRTALHFSNIRVTYSELLSLAGSYARTIRKLQEPSEVVAILAERSLDAYAGILGILLAGKAYLPLNPGFPTERNAYILEKSGTSTLLFGAECLKETESLVSIRRRSLNIVCRDMDSLNELGILDMHSKNLVDHEIMDIPGDLSVDPDKPAYLLFTSGSTGVPKGVSVSNSNVCAYLDNISSMVDFLAEDRFTQTFDLTFDLSVHDMFVCWSSGACLCIPEDNSTFGIIRYLKQMQPTVWFSVPSVAVLLQRMRLLKKEAFPWLRLSFFCGEALLEETAISWAQAASNSEVINLYGPTEATIAVSSYILPGDPRQIKSLNGIVSIGRLFEGHDFVLSDEEDGKGILCVSGTQVVAGYFEDEVLSRQYFFEYGTPSPNEHATTSHRYYITGDRVQLDVDGDFFFLGRADAEVKISGYRVNLLEIDHAIASMDRVKQAVTLYLKPGSGDAFLVSFIVSKEKGDDIPAIIGHCRQKLPTYMVPEKIIFVDDIPLNANGKTDRNALTENYWEHYG